MLELYFIACLTATPTTCRPVTLNFENPYEFENVTPQQCAHNGMPEMVKWFEEHPAYHLKKFRCGVAGKMGHDI